MIHNEIGAYNEESCCLSNPVCGDTACCCSHSRGAAGEKVPRIGYLSSFDPVTDSARTETIRLALRELGYIEGQSIAIEYRYAEGKVDRQPELAVEVVRLRVDIIVVAVGAGPIRVVKNATKTIPIVMAGLPADPVELGLVESLARPGGNVTSLTLLFRELGGKRLELLKEAVPKLNPVAVLYDPTNSGGTRLPLSRSNVGYTCCQLKLRFPSVLQTQIGWLSQKLLPIQ